MYQSNNSVIKTSSSIDNLNAKPILTNTLIIVMSIACGLTVANLYYIQPLLADIAKTFHVNQLSIGYASMLTQIGYAIGMILVLPLGDIKEKRNLIVLMLLFSIISLMSMFFSANIYVLIISSFAVGFTSIIPQLLKSLVHLIKTEPVLRESSINGALVFAAFSAFWTSLISLLESSHYNMGAEAAGLLGLVGISGALATPIVGKITDKRGSRFAIGICIVIVIISYGLFYLFGFKMWGLILGIILLDLGVQSCNVSNQARVHALNEETRNRLNTIYMVSFFLGGALGSFLGSYSYSHFGWYGVCTFGMITQIIAFVMHNFRKNR